MTADAFRMERRGPCSVIVMPADVDVTNSEQASQALLAALGQRPAALIVDMTQTAFCDSTGIAALVGAYHYADANGIQLMLVAPGIGRILRLTGFDDIVPMHPDLEAACAAADPGSRD